VRGSLSMPAADSRIATTLLEYVRSGGAWTGSETQLLAKSAGLFHLMTGSSEYQLI